MDDYTEYLRQGPIPDETEDLLELVAEAQRGLARAIRERYGDIPFAMLTNVKALLPDAADPVSTMAVLPNDMGVAMALTHELHVAMEKAREVPS